MTYDQRMATGKPYIVGFIIGVFAAPIVAFSAGWVSTSGARETAVENARIETLSAICFASVERRAASESIDLAKVKGYENREKREALVAAAMSDFNVPAELAKSVAGSCNRTLA